MFQAVGNASTLTWESRKTGALLKYTGVNGADLPLFVSWNFGASLNKRVFILNFTPLCKQ